MAAQNHPEGRSEPASTYNPEDLVDSRIFETDAEVPHVPEGDQKTAVARIITDSAHLLEREGVIGVEAVEPREPF